MNKLATSILLAVLVAPAGADAETLAGTVVRIVDGDTVVVLDADKVQHRIRLSGIDTPERKQPFGTRAKQHLGNLIGNETVPVQWDKRDRWQRIIGKVLLDGEDQNLVMVEDGFAWWFRRYQREQPPEDRDRYEAAEDRARAAGLGLWVDPNPIPPWEWRKR